MFRSSLMGALVAALLFLGVPAVAHERRAVGRVETSVGWLTEPAFAGAVNGVSFRASRDGAGVTGANLKVDVTFDGAAEPLTLALEPAFRDPGHYEAHLIPTRPGAYTFRIYGRLAGATFDQTFISGEDTFDPIVATSEIEYPAKDPTRDELAQRAAVQEARITSLSKRASDATDGTAVAFWVAIAGVVLGLVSLAVAWRTKRRLA